MRPRQAARAALAIAHADVRARVRTRAFLLVLALTAWFVVLFLPPADAGYLTVAFGAWRGVYDSAWIGLMLGIVGTSFLPLAGFYLVKNGVARDRRTGVGLVLAATPISRGTYVVGRWLGSTAVLALVLATMAVTGAVMQLVRAEARGLDALALVEPLVMMALPVLALVAAVALLCEMLPVLRGAAGNVLFFLAWVGVLGTSASRTAAGPATHPLHDPFGMARPIAAVQAQIHAVDPTYHGAFLVGRSETTGQLRLLRWEGMGWSGAPALERLAWVGLAGLLLLAAVALFDRFDPARAGRTSARLRLPTLRLPALRRPWGTPTPAGAVRAPGAAPRALPPDPAPGLLTPLDRRGSRPSTRFAALVGAELRLALRGRPWWWYAVAGALVLAGLVNPGLGGLEIVVPAAFLWAVLALSPAGARPALHGMDRVLLAAPRPVRAQLLAGWLAGAATILLLASGVVVRLAAYGAWAPLGAMAIGALFVSALALALGSLSGGSRLTELVFLLGWYAAVNGDAALDFMGRLPATPDSARPAVYGALAALLVAAAMLGRWRRLRR